MTAEELSFAYFMGLLLLILLIAFFAKLGYLMYLYRDDLSSKEIDRLKELKRLNKAKSIAKLYPRGSQI